MNVHYLAAGKSFSTLRQAWEEAQTWPNPSVVRMTKRRAHIITRLGNGRIIRYEVVYAS